MADHITNIESLIIPLFLTAILPMVCTIATFLFLAFVIKEKSRASEREAFHRNEVMQKIAASPDGASTVIEFLREERGLSEKKRQQKLRLNGLITAAVGLGLMIYLFARHYSDHDAYEHLIGVIPFLIGVAILIYSYWLAPKE